MKNILKTMICIGVSALTIVGACACHGGVSDMRRLERRLQRERALQQERIEQQPENELDPDFFVDAEENKPQDDNGEGNSKCPDCPQESDDAKDEDKKDEDEEEHSELLPERGKRPPRRSRRKGPKPVPYPVPEQPSLDEPTDSSF